MASSSRLYSLRPSIRVLKPPSTPVRMACSRDSSAWTVFSGVRMSSVRLRSASRTDSRKSWSAASVRARCSPSSALGSPCVSLSSVRSRSAWSWTPSSVEVTPTVWYRDSPRSSDQPSLTVRLSTKPQSALKDRRGNSSNRKILNRIDRFCEPMSQPRSRGHFHKLCKYTSGRSHRRLAPIMRLLQGMNRDVLRGRGARLKKVPNGTRGHYHLVSLHQFPDGPMGCRDGGVRPRRGRRVRPGERDPAEPPPRRLRR